MGNINYPAPEQEYKVLVRCFTYNQSKYIEDSLNGFAMQQTCFPFVCLVMDDSSTDGEQDVITEWMQRECDVNRAEIIDIPTSIVYIVPHKTNSNCLFAFYLLKQNLYGTGDRKMNHVYPWRDKCKYEAICEGDDYWTDSFKLQKQVDFLDAHPEAIMCFHNAVKIYENEEHPMSIFNGLSKSGYVTLRQLINSWIIPTASIVYRTELMNDYPKWSSKIYSGDLTLSLVAFSKGKIYYFHGPMSVYRINRGNGTSMSSMVKKSKIGYVESQHITLYEYYDEYTNYVYHDILSAKISELRKEIRFQKNKNRSLILAIFSQPLFFVKKLVKKFFS